MATIVLSAVGAAVGSSIGGSVLGLSAAVVGRAVGATIGRVIDQRVLGAGSAAVETGKVDRFRLMGASEGAAVSVLWGRMRVPGQVIWATRFQEYVTQSGGSGKGAPPQPKTRSYSYSISLAIALCEGSIARVGRIWADGVEIEKGQFNLRIYHGTEDQVPDPKIAAVEGLDAAPAYKGVAYVVFEDLDLGRFGNRVPQFTFEVVRSAQSGQADALSDLVRGVALVPGTGEYALATTPVRFDTAPGASKTANAHTTEGRTDLDASLTHLAEELPNCGSALLVVSWFADDLRCGQCTIRPKVEQRQLDGVGMPWTVNGISRAEAELVPQVDGRPVYGGTSTDAAVLEAIAALKASGKSVVFYPFILMDQIAQNGRTDPWTGSPDQPVLPWRGRITLSVAPGQPETPDATSVADTEVAAFFGTASASQFQPGTQSVSYTGPSEWGLRRMILHYAHLCTLAGGVDGFCIGSELRGLTQIRGPAGTFPAVEALRSLAADVRSILGPETKIGYAADWSEYFGYQPQDGSGNVYFHLDPLWSDPNVDFIGIDNYMPLSDWRDGETHADASFGSVHSLDYLRSGVAGGEGFDWYYASDAERDAQIRTPIADGAHGEPWVFRYKDLRNWWDNPHHERINGVRSPVPTAWQPRSKPFWFTEYGCPAIDKGSNEPNKFVDPKSSESALPRYSRGNRDDLIQVQYLRAVASYWDDPVNNPVSDVYGEQMVDMSRAHAWAWDVRPYPQFPGLSDVWSDAQNYVRGHWLNGRMTAAPLSSVVAEICQRSGVTDVDASAVYGLVRGYVVPDIEAARASLQPLLLAYGIEAIEREGRLLFRNRTLAREHFVAADRLALTQEQDTAVEITRTPDAEVAGRVRLVHVEADGDFGTRVAEAASSDRSNLSVSQTDLALVLTPAEGRGTVERWMNETRIARDSIKFALPPSALEICAGDIVRLECLDGARYRVDRIENGGALLCEAVRAELHVHQPSLNVEEVPPVARFTPAFPAQVHFLDLPLVTGSEVPHAPHVLATAEPWPGSVAVYASPIGDQGYSLNRLLDERATAGTTATPLARATPGVWDRGSVLRVRISSGRLDSATEDAVLAGMNLAVIGDGSAEGWEVFQFRDALLIGPGEYELSGLLRGQLGTDADMPDLWPAGSVFALVTPALQQIDLPLNARRLVRHYRIGPGQRPYDDPSYVHRIEAFSGIGLRPYTPAHLRLERQANGDLALSWVRRTRIGGDSWESDEVPLGEEAEAYRVRVLDGDAVALETSVSTPGWIFSADAQASLGPLVAPAVAVAQVSAIYGAGPFTRLNIDE